MMPLESIAQKSISRGWPSNEAPLSAQLDETKVAAVRQEILQAIKRSEYPSYVYTYPPRQTYRPLPDSVDDNFVFQALSETPNNFNLYIHFPFCNQICQYCNLFAVAGKESLIDDYITALSRELQYYAKELRGHPLRTVYFGGGTPALLSNQQLGRVLSIIDKHFPGFIDSCDELCVEAAPDTMSPERAHFFKSLGITRVNLGVQTFSDEELRGLGRNYISDVGRVAISALQEARIGNICVDLIYGLLDQTREAWESSIAELALMGPETICIYRLVVRPATGYYTKQNSLADSKELYTRYDIAWQILIDNGYQQETNVRFILPGIGGYKQIEYHWEGATVLGLGAGARTYAPRIHFRNGYSSRRRASVLIQYLNNIATQGHSRVDGFIFDLEEQIRREFALNLHRLNINAFQRLYERTFEDCFPTQIQALQEEGILRVGAQKVIFEPKGFKYRDLVSRMFFSERVMRLEADYTYDD